MPRPQLGKFDVLGQTVDGKSYRGSARIWEVGVFHRIELAIDGQETVSGLGRRAGDLLAFALGPKHKVEIGVYRIDGDSLRGLWVPPDAQGEDLAICGREWSEQTAPGTYTIREAHAITGEKYQGKITVTPIDVGSAIDETDFARPVRMHWLLDDGTFDAVALQTPAAIFAAFSFAPQSLHGVGVYQIIDEGYQVLAYHNDGSLRKEVLSNK